MTTPNRPPLSPAAQAVLDTYGNEVGGIAAITSYERRGIAAALRAAADQVVPERKCNTRTDRGYQRTLVRRELYVIATELEGAQPRGSTH